MMVETMQEYSTSLVFPLPYLPSTGVHAILNEVSQNVVIDHEFFVVRRKFTHQLIGGTRN